MEIFKQPDFINKGARHLYDFLKIKYADEFKSAEDVRLSNKYTDEYMQELDHLDEVFYLDEELIKFLINICQDIYDNKDKVEEILNN